MILKNAFLGLNVLQDDGERWILTCDIEGDSQMRVSIGRHVGVLDDSHDTRIGHYRYPLASSLHNMPKKITVTDSKSCPNIASSSRQTLAASTSNPPCV
jgi:hypothetical protein